MIFVKKLVYLFIYIAGAVVHAANKANAFYMTRRIQNQLGGGKRVFQYPYRVSGINHIQCGENVNVGKDAILMCTRANIIFKGHFVSGPGLKIIAGDHMAVVGQFIDEVSDDNKNCVDIDSAYDKNVVIEEDVWAGANVTILKGVTIGRGCIIAAGSVVTKTMPVYCIIGGVPAKPLKLRWSIDQIMKHEQKLYKEHCRISKDAIVEIAASLERKV